MSGTFTIVLLCMVIVSMTSTAYAGIGWFRLARSISNDKAKNEREEATLQHKLNKVIVDIDEIIKQYDEEEDR